MPLMTCYLTDRPADDLARGHAEGVFTAAKLYPARHHQFGRSGVTDIRKI
jgi:dihydroorotase